jgi:hypothetical protein
MFWQHFQTVSTFCGHKALYTSMRHFLVIAVIIATGALTHVSVAAADQSRAHPLRVPKAKLLRSNPHRFTAIRLQGTNPYDAPDDEFICASSARRPKVAPPSDPSDDELSKYVQVRLAVARARAMARYREIHA